MIIPSRLDYWLAEAVIRVYEPWLTSGCTGISARQRREVAAMVSKARRLTGPHPLAPEQPAVPPQRAVRTETGRWIRFAA